VVGDADPDRQCFGTWCVDHRDGIRGLQHLIAAGLASLETMNPGRQPAVAFH
jgi:hypothetical protein